jgi:hypothetical protein
MVVEDWEEPGAGGAAGSSQLVDRLGSTGWIRAADDEQNVILNEAAGAGIAERALRFAIRGIRVRQQDRVGEQVSLRVIQQGAHQRSNLPRSIVGTGSDYWHFGTPLLL